MKNTNAILRREQCAFDTVLIAGTLARGSLIAAGHATESWFSANPNKTDALILSVISFNYATAAMILPWLAGVRKRNVFKNGSCNA